jgi:hypothetical protein
MDIKYFNLIDGSLEFYDKKILIFDKARRNRIAIWLVTIGGLTYSIVTLIKGYRLHDNENLWFGLILTILWILISIFRRKQFQKIENEIFLSNINRVTFSIDKFDGSIVAKIMTKNNLQRRIKIVQEDNQDFEFKNLLVEHKIKID